MYEPVDAFLHHPDWEWLTVGDGRMGLDSIRIKKRGIKHVLPTDICSDLLEKSKSEGHIEDYRCENAEKMTFEDESYDVVFCKESYHHFPRPAIAVYEMLRVARQAVIFIEPRDYVIDRPNYRPKGPAGLAKDLVRWLKFKLHIPEQPIQVEERYTLGDKPAYETVGNYIYATSSREFEKMALGLNFPAVAFKGLNDYFEPALGSEPCDDSSEAYRRMRQKIADGDKNAISGRTSTTLLMAIIFKISPDEQTRSFLKENDWVVKDLDRNPYIGEQED